MCNSLALTSDDIRTGLIRGITFGYKPITYAVVDGLAVFEGCIVLGTAEEMERNTADIRRAIEAAGDDPEGVQHGVGISNQSFRWPNREVAYEIDPALPDQQRVHDAIDHWTANTDFTFVLRTAVNENDHPNFVRFIPDQGCYSYVGMQLGGQVIGLANGCSTGNVIHEIGHLAGLWHEQSREDRDDFIRINWQNILSNQFSQFDQHITDGDDYGDYDYESIMHYGRLAFTNNGLPTIDVLQAGATIGQRTQLSQGDKDTLRAMYPMGDPAMVSPDDGETMTDARETFVWTANGSQINQWWLYIGSKPGRSDLHNSGSLGTTLSTTVLGLPVDGSDIYVRLWHRINVWESVDYQYKAAEIGEPEISRPAPSSVLPDTEVTFRWTANGAPVSLWALYVGHFAGDTSIYNTGVLSNKTSATVAGLPMDGSEVYVTLWYWLGSWHQLPYRYTAAAPRSPALTSPEPGTQLSRSLIFFKWSANGSQVSEWWLYLGRTQGASDIVNTGSLGSRAGTIVHSLPTDGSTIHVRLWYRQDQGWNSEDYQYIAAN